jgi:hypothetical protein
LLAPEEKSQKEPEEDLVQDEKIEPPRFESDVGTGQGLNY